MDLRKFAEFTRTGYYPVIAAVAASGIGLAVGFAVDRILPGSKDEAEPDWDLPEIPEGVNEIGTDRDGDGTIPFSKPDLSKLVDYTKFSEKVGKHASASDGDAEEEPPTDSGQDDPRMEIIDEQEFMKSTGNLDGYVSVTGGYFVQDGILAGWDEKMEEKDPGETVGWRAVKMFESPDVKAVYVRNSQVKVLYEILRYDDTFEEVTSELLGNELERDDPGEDAEG